MGCPTCRVAWADDPTCWSCQGPGQPTHLSTNSLGSLAHPQGIRDDVLAARTAGSNDADDPCGSGPIR